VKDGVAVHILRNGSRGRPSKVISRELLEEVFSGSRRITKTQLAKAIGVHRHTVRKYLHQSGLRSLCEYSDMRDEELDDIVRKFNSERPDSGGSYLWGEVSNRGFRVQRRRVRESQHRVDPIATHLRHQAPIQRRTYSVKRPNALWHMDGYHKLVTYGIVIHGVVDGYSRKVWDV
jgi:hypothetical protein